MALYAYIRVSSEKQSYDRQLYQLNEYFDRCGVDKDKVQFIEEKITSYTSFRQRAIYPVLKSAKEGDMVYACQVDRFGRTVEDLIQLVDYADERGVELQSLKESMRVTRKTPIGKMILTMMATAAEMERDNFAERRQYGIKAAKEEIAKNGYRISRISGRTQTKWGNAKGTEQTAKIMETAREAAAIMRAEAKMKWKQDSVAYKWVMEKHACGWARNMIIEEFNKLHGLQPTVFCTREGKPMSKGILSKWINEANPLA